MDEIEWRISSWDEIAVRIEGRLGDWTCASMLTLYELETAYYPEGILLSLMNYLECQLIGQRIRSNT